MLMSVSTIIIAQHEVLRSNYSSGLRPDSVMIVKKQKFPGKKELTNFTERGRHSSRLRPDSVVIVKKQKFPVQKEPPSIPVRRGFRRQTKLTRATGLQDNIGVVDIRKSKMRQEIKRK